VTETFSANASSSAIEGWAVNYPVHFLATRWLFCLQRVPGPTVISAQIAGFPSISVRNRACARARLLPAVAMKKRWSPAPPAVLILLFCLLVSPLLLHAQAPPSLQKLGESLYRIGQLRVDTAKREVSAPATINDVMTLEFAANTKGGLKAYESAITVESDAITFNAALLLIGLDPSRGRPSKHQFDPATPEGDPVSVEIAFRDRRVPIEELLFDQRTNRTLRRGSWVYTGSTFYDDGVSRRFMAEVDGVLVGMMHGPAALIENAGDDAVKGYGSFIINPKLGVPPGSTVTLIVTALKK
jgi:hypothetical protein